MVRRTVLCAIVSAAVCVPALLGVVSARQPSAQPVLVDADDLGGVVTGAKGPEARRLGHRRNARTCRPSSRRSSSPTIRAATCFPICRRPPTASGCAAMVSSIRAKTQAAPGRALNLTAVAAPDAKAAAEYYPAGYWFSLLSVPGQERVSRHRTDGQRHRADHHAVRPNGCAA